MDVCQTASVTSRVNITIDLAGYKWNCASLSVGASASVTIEDSSQQNSGQINGSINNAGTFTLNSGTITNNETVLSNSGNFIMNDGLISSGESPIFNFVAISS